MKISEVCDIPVSGKQFLRESEPFDAFNRRIYPHTLKDGASDAPIRLWVRGRSAQEAACSPAINLAEPLRNGPQIYTIPAFPANVNQAPVKKTCAGLTQGKPAEQPHIKEGLQMELIDIRDHQLLERSARRLATLVHDYSDAVIIRDFKDRVVAWNRGAQKMYGYTEEEALGMDVSRLIPKKTPIRAREFVRLTAQGNKAAPIAARRRTKDGRILDVELTFTVLCDDKGFPVEVATIERDVTKQKRDERELRRLHVRVVSAQETERKRLSRELHDGVGQILSGVKFRMESLPGEIALSGKDAAKIIKVAGLLSHAISEIRSVSQNLMPSELVDLGLEPALRKLCREFKERAGVPVTLKTGSALPDIAPELALALFRIAQEALNNIGKHSKATMAAVAFSHKGGEIVLSVSDNGVGFAPGGNRSPNGRGIGLGSMRERAESVGGCLKFYSTPGVGTTLRVRAPLSGAGGNIQ